MNSGNLSIQGNNDTFIWCLSLINLERENHILRQSLQFFLVKMDKIPRAEGVLASFMILQFYSLHGALAQINPDKEGKATLVIVKVFGAPTLGSTI